MFINDIGIDSIIYSITVQKLDSKSNQISRVKTEPRVNPISYIKLDFAPERLEENHMGTCISTTSDK